MDLPTWRPSRGIPESPPPPPSSPQNLVLTPSAEGRRNDSLLAGLQGNGQRCQAPVSTTEESAFRPGADTSAVSGFNQHDLHRPAAGPSPPESPLSSKPAPDPARTSHFSRTLVLDTGAFLRLKRLDQFGRDFVVPPSVLREIRDARARAHIAGVTWLHPECELPTVMAATEQDKRWARKFASMTGDLGVLSGTDLDVIALTYMLQRRTGRVEKLRTKPLEPTVVRETSAPTETWDSGWWGCSKSSGSDRDTSEGKGETGDGTVSDSSAEDQDDSSFAGAAEDKASMLTEGEKEREEQDRRHEKRECTGVAERDGISAEETTEFPSGKDKAPPADEGSVAVPAGSIVDMGVAETREIVDVVGDDDDREGVWITSENLSRFKREVEGVSAGRKEEALVACMTTDYSVQNVLLQMGLDVVTIDGLAVRSVKSWALICRACHFVSREVTRLFCEKCGQHAVDRVPVTLTDDGLVVHDNRKKKSTRGNIHSLPKPRGGRHEKQLILAEDQLMLGGRDRMLRHQQRLWEKENSAHNPFSDDCVFDAASSWHVRARTRTGKLVAGTHAPRVVVGLGPGNPNSNRWVKSHARSKRK